VALLDTKEKDEIGLIKQSINELIKGTESRVLFANEIAKGNFDVEYEMLSEDDTAGKSLLNMRENLKHAQEQEVERMKEVEIQNWITRGLAKFADTLRQDNDNIKKLATNFITELINYTKVTQGALFVKNDTIPEDTFYEVIAAVAYSREKILDAKFKIGEGLVGRAAYEKLTIYMTDVPQNYVKITSGLGESNPNCILLVPLVAEDDVVGVIELVSFNEFEPYQIEFVEKLAVNMASTLVNVRINERTMYLLNESRKQREELMAQEEEVRQNLEEMTAIKEEAARKEEEMNTLWRAVKEENCVAVYETNGHIIEANNQFIELFTAYIKDRTEMNIKDIVRKCFANESEYTNFCNKIAAGRSQHVELEVEKDGATVRFIQSHVPMRNANGLVDKMMSIGMIVK
jgi:PAS domain-containing protein